MFHINLDNRVIVSSERYSFPGLPCLYLGTSSFVCWVEMDCPKLEDFQVARIIKKEQNVKVLDLCILPKEELKISFIFDFGILRLCIIFRDELHLLRNNLLR